MKITNLTKPVILISWHLVFGFSCLVMILRPERVIINPQDFFLYWVLEFLTISALAMMYGKDKYGRNFPLKYRRIMMIIFILPVLYAFLLLSESKFLVVIYLVNIMTKIFIQNVHEGQIVGAYSAIIFLFSTFIGYSYGEKIIEILNIEFMNYLNDAFSKDDVTFIIWGLVYGFGIAIAEILHRKGKLNFKRFEMIKIK